MILCALRILEDPTVTDAFIEVGGPTTCSSADVAAIVPTHSPARPAGAGNVMADCARCTSC